MSVPSATCPLLGLLEDAVVRWILWRQESFAQGHLIEVSLRDFSFKFYSTFIIRISQKLILKSNYLNYIALHVCLQILIIIEGKCDMKNSFYLTRGLISLMSNRSLGSFLFLNALASVPSTVSKSLYYCNWIVYFFKKRRN